MTCVAVIYYSANGSVHALAQAAGDGAEGADADGNGRLDEDRLYQLVRQPGAVQERTFEITFHAGGVEAYGFTFG